MSFPPEFLKSLGKARQLVSERRFPEAEPIYQSLVRTGIEPEGVLRELFQHYMQSGQVGKAADCLEQLATRISNRPEYWLQLAQLSQSSGNADKAIFAYRSFLRRVPDRPSTVFNFAYLLRHEGYLEEAVDWYRKALCLGISGQEEVYTNIGVILSELRRESEAAESYEQALSINEEYIPAIVNLAALNEESGKKEAALALYHKALEIDGQHCLALCRLANLERGNSEEDPLVKKLSKLVKDNSLSRGDREELYFALGKLLDDCGSYRRAFESYRAANQLGSTRFPPYESERKTQYVDDLMQIFSGEWFSTQRSSISTSPIFICGMFRSGSTLVEQVLGGHHQITSGGELDFFPELVRQLNGDFLSAIQGMSDANFFKIGEDYLQYLSRRFPASEQVTDKRPDNFLYIGLIKTVFPRARIIWTRRGILDNCLSIYFQQLGGDMNYSVDLESIGHYYAEQVRLMRHWQSLFPESILEVGYEALVEDPESEVKRMLSFLGLPWDANCLDFTARKNYVKTASIWQVREGIHKRSRKRHSNYREYLQVLEQFLDL